MASAVTNQVSERARWISPVQQLTLLEQKDPLLRAVTSKLAQAEMAEYAIAVARPPIFSYWYQVLHKIQVIPPKIPPLPENIHEIFQERCVFNWWQTVGDSHELFLIPQELGTLNQLIDRVRSNARIQEMKGVEIHLSEEVRQKYGDTPFGPSHWILIAKNLLPASKGQPDSELVRMIERVNQVSRRAYHIPSLQDAVTACLFHQIATGKSLFVDRWDDACFDCFFTFTAAQQPGEEVCLAVSGSSCAILGGRRDTNIVTGWPCAKSSEIGVMPVTDPWQIVQERQQKRSN